MTEKPRMELSATQVAGGALAAASAAVAASVFGVYGTIIGAVVGSIVASVGGAIYTHSFRRGREAITRVRVSRTGRLAAVDGEQPAEASGDEPEPRQGWRGRLAGVNPRTVGVTAACVLAVSLGVITGAEALLKEPISSAVGGGDKGGNSLDRAFNGGGSGHRGTDGGTSPSPTPTTSVTMTTSPGTPTGSPSTRPAKPTTFTSTGTPTTSKPTTTVPPTTSTGLPTEPPSTGAPQSP